MSADEDRAAAGDQDAFAREKHLVLVFQSTREELQEPSLRQHLGDLSPDAISGQREQATSLIVGQRDGAVAVRCDRTFVDALQARLSFLKQSRDLVRLQSKRLSLQAPCQ